VAVNVSLMYAEGRTYISIERLGIRNNPMRSLRPDVRLCLPKPRLSPGLLRYLVRVPAFSGVFVCADDTGTASCAL